MGEPIDLQAEIAKTVRSIASASMLKPIKPLVLKTGSKLFRCSAAGGEYHGMDEWAT